MPSRDTAVASATNGSVPVPMFLASSLVQPQNEQPRPRGFAATQGSKQSGGNERQEHTCRCPYMRRTDPSHVGDEYVGVAMVSSSWYRLGE